MVHLSVLMFGRSRAWASLSAAIARDGPALSASSGQIQKRDERAGNGGTSRQIRQNRSRDRPLAALEEEIREREQTLRPHDPPGKRRARQVFLLVGAAHILLSAGSVGNIVHLRSERVKGLCPRATCDAAVATLVKARFRSRTPEGLFVMGQKLRSGWAMTDPFEQSAPAVAPRFQTTAVRTSRRPTYCRQGSRRRNQPVVSVLPDLSLTRSKRFSGPAMPVVRKRDAQSAEQPCDLHDRPCRVLDPSADRIQRRRTWRASRRPHRPEHDAPRALPAFTTLDVERPPITANSIIVTV